jgi:glutathione S-transferase
LHKNSCFYKRVSPCLADYPHAARVLAVLKQDPGLRFAHTIKGGSLAHLALDQLELPTG